MKMKLCSVLTAVILILSQEMAASAAAIPNTATNLNAQNSGARSTITLTFRGDSYTTTQESVQCRCEISLQRVTAGTDKSNSTVTISSKSYNSTDATGTNGSDGNAAANTIAVTYTATSTIKYTYQEHGTPSTTVKITLIRY